MDPWLSNRRLARVIIPPLDPFPPHSLVRAGSTSIVRDPAMLARFTGATSRQQLDELATGFVDAIRAGNHTQRGYPNTM